MSPSLAAIRTANTAFTPSALPITVFVGGTSGIGQATARAFARYTNGTAHIVLVGRNAAAAAATIASFPPPPPGVTHEFVACDASLIADVRTAATALRARLPRVDFLVLSAGTLDVAGRVETGEGLDRKLALNYYARWTWVRELMPLLEAAGRASVLSVLAAGKDGSINREDLGLERTYSLINVMTASSTYSDLMLAEFAKRHSSVAFTHMFPGLVGTPLLRPSNWLLGGLTSALMYPFAASPDVCAEYVLHALLSAESGKLTRRGPKTEDLGASTYATDEARLLLWKHTEEATGIVA